MNLSLLKQLTQSKECGHLEFKREWYWNTNEKPSEKADIQKKWGEFIEPYRVYRRLFYLS